MHALPRTLLLAVSFSSLAAFAQAEPPLLPAPYPTPAATNAAPAAPLPTDPIKFGAQFHGEIHAGTNGFGPTASFGLGFNRVAILFAPEFLVSSFGGATVNSISLALAVRIYFKERKQAAIVGFIKPEAALGAALNGGSAFGVVGVAGGAEYLLTRNLGFTIELGVRLHSAGFTLSTAGSLGIMLHT